MRLEPQTEEEYRQLRTFEGVLNWIKQYAASPEFDNASNPPFSVNHAKHIIISAIKMQHVMETSDEHTIAIIALYSLINLEKANRKLLEIIRCYPASPIIFKS